MEANGRCAGNFLRYVEVTWLVIRLNYERLLVFSTLFGLAAACLFAPAATESMRSQGRKRPLANPLPPLFAAPATNRTHHHRDHRSRLALPGTARCLRHHYPCRSRNLQPARRCLCHCEQPDHSLGHRQPRRRHPRRRRNAHLDPYHIIAIFADDVTIADLTLRNGDEHGVSVNGSDRPILYNLHILDTGYQLVKVNPVGDGSEDGLLACSRLEYTTTSPEDYTNGISAHNAHRWTVRDNEWRRIRTPNQVPAPAILFLVRLVRYIVERNLLVDCYQGIAFGNASHDAGDHTGALCATT
ncbi:MAG: hypothetical protein IPH82_30075 [Chloroflexi bacterium]|nr:hypothetical protein [Chloroflexota bacterium]